MRREWEEAHKVTEELVEGPPSRRANATLTACPNGVSECKKYRIFSAKNPVESSLVHWRRILQRGRESCEYQCMGFLQNTLYLQYFYNDVFRYSPEKVSHPHFILHTPNNLTMNRMNGGNSYLRRAQALVLLMPLSAPRLGAESCSYLVGSGACCLKPHSNKRTLTGGEFSSLYQNSFHHYRDFWCFDVATHSWDRIDTKIRPTARSGHRYVPLLLYFLVLIGPI